MALLGSYIDSRTLAAIALNSSSSYAHGLPADPDCVLIEQIVSTTSSTTWIGFLPLHNATNVTVHNIGNQNSQNLRAVAVVFHSIMR